MWKCITSYFCPMDYVVQTWHFGAVVTEALIDAEPHGKLVLNRSQRHLLLPATTTILHIYPLSDNRQHSLDSFLILSLWAVRPFRCFSDAFLLTYIRSTVSNGGWCIVPRCLSFGCWLLASEDDVHVVVQELRSVVQDLRTDMNTTLRNVEKRLQNIGKVGIRDHGTPQDGLVFLYTSLAIIQ